MELDSALIQKAKISISFKFNDGAVSALKIPTFANVYVEGAVSGENLWCTQPTEAWVLMYPRHYLEKDGFISVRFLEELRTKHQQMWGIYGPPKDWGDQRCHLLYAARYAKEDFQVSDWEIKEWTKKTLKI